MAKQLFYVPVCITNLAKFFAFGFITPASVFPFKHYFQDEFSLHPTRIPLHKKPTAKNKIPRKGLDASKQESINLKSAVLIISLEDVDVENVDACPWSYYNGILPTYFIREIIFEDQKAHEDFDYLTKNSGRVGIDFLASIKLKVSDFDKLFEAAPAEKELAINSEQLNSENIQSPLVFDENTLQKMSGYGAALALSYVMAKNSKLASDAFKHLAELSTDSDLRFVVQELHSYLCSQGSEDDLKQRLRNEFFDVLIDFKGDGKILDKLVTFFDMDFEDDKARYFLQNLKETSVDIQKGKVQATKSVQLKQFDKVEKPSEFISQIVTMFSLLNDTEKLFNQPVSTVTDEGYLNIAIAYGLRDKFYELPKLVRQIDGLEKFVIERMYRYFKMVIASTPTSDIVFEKSNFKEMPTFVDIFSDPDTPQLKYALSKRFGLIERDVQQEVNIDGNRYIPENSAELINTYEPESKYFSELMIMQKAFDDIDFNYIFKLYEAEKSIVKARKKLEQDLKKL